MFANRFDIARFLELTDDGSTPNAHRLARVLQALAGWADSNSDGWHSWPKPARAAGGIITRLEALERAWHTGGFIVDISDTETTKALTPVKAFLTRQQVTDDVRAAILDEPRPDLDDFPHLTRANNVIASIGRHPEHVAPAPTSSRPHLLEAVCGDCAETFIPAGEDDLEHGERENGEPCGGPGVIVGSWHFTPRTRETLSADDRDNLSKAHTAGLLEH